MNLINRLKMSGEEIHLQDFAASYQHAIVQSLVTNAIDACKMHNIRTLCLAGGVSANRHLRDVLRTCSADENIHVQFPPPVLCTDNAAMIACAGYYRFIEGKRDDLSMNAEPSLTLQ